MSKFKVGDKVRYTDSEGPWVDYQVTKGCEGVVTGRTDDGDIEVNFGGYAEVFEENLELVTPADPKREFLQRLQALLRDFDARIYSDFDQSDEINTMTIMVGNDEFRYTYVDFITADNVMDFDKE